MPDRSASRRRSSGSAAADEPPRDNRRRLLDAALTLFADQGYSATGTQQIIDAAGVSKPVLYHYFGSKEALFRELAGGICDATAAAWAAIIARETTATARLRGIARLSFEGSARDPRIPRLLLQTHYGPPIAELRSFMDDLTSRRFAAVVEIVAAGMATGEFRGGDARSLALVFCCLMDQHVNALARLPDAASHLTAARADALVDAFLHGCGTGPRKAFQFPALTFDT